MMTIQQPIASVRGRNMWKVGFHFGSFGLINLMSGLVEVSEVIWKSDEKVLLFVVESMDKTGTLFRRGALHAAAVGGYVPSGQPMVVQGPNVAFQPDCGGNQCLTN